MTANFSGNWKFVESENFDAFLEALGVDPAMREIVQSTIPRETIMQDGDTFNIKTIAQKITEVKFKVGEEFEGEIQQGKVKISPTLDGGKLRFEFDSPKGKQVQEREVRPDGRLYLVLTAPDGTKCTRIFARE
ncbi:cellular retinoic acid-binding protein 2-like [Branchiostoma floridae]|uniref:Cellular retinoic acid-binding protein 2-like n=1 Tax=Branchiostoma floridae TaxID=7739 RepID=A0A9J7HGJ3_BRAFL|nr:cellular retinoic acid-binding protein 2-like [Branchiostoma floridae]